MYMSILVCACAARRKSRVTLTHIHEFAFKTLMLLLHYVPGGHGGHDFDHRGRNRVTVTQHRGTGSTNVVRRGCRDRFLNSQKICHGSLHGIDLLKLAVVEGGERNKT